MTTIVQYFAAGACKTPNFLSFPTWYQFLPTAKDCSPKIGSLTDIWLVVAAILDILLRVAALVAVGYVIYGGVKYTISQGNPDETTKARATILNALTGLFIAVTASAIVQFVAGRIS